MKRGSASSVVFLVISLSLGLLTSPARSISIPDLGGGGKTPTPTASPSPSKSPTPSPTVSTSPSPSLSPTPSPSSTPSPTTSPTPAASTRLLLQAISPLNSSRTVVVPAKFSNLPPILLRVPEAWKDSDRKKSISMRSWCKEPKEILADVYIGGDCNLALIPLASISISKIYEVQTLVFTPTRVLIRDLPLGKVITLVIKKPNGKIRTLGTASISSDGQLTLPPITLGKSGRHIDVELSLPNDKKYSFVLRTIK